MLIIHHVEAAVCERGVLCGSRRVRSVEEMKVFSQESFFPSVTERKQPPHKGEETPQTSDMDPEALLLFILTSQLQIQGERRDPLTVYHCLSLQHRQILPHVKR